MAIRKPLVNIAGALQEIPAIDEPYFPSKTANTIYAAPNGSAGAPSFRVLVAADIPTLSYAPTNNPTFTGTITFPANTTVARADNINITNDATNPSTVYPVLVQTVGGYIAPTIASAKISFVPSTGVLTATSFSGNMLTKAVTETSYPLAGTDINPVNGTIQTKTLSGNTTFTESLANGQSVVLHLNPSTFSATWFTTSWVNSAGTNTAPTLKASALNVLVFWQVDNVLYGNWIGSL